MASEMTQKLKALDTKPEFDPQDPRGRKREPTPKLSSELHMCTAA